MENVRITVGLGSCGVSSGADKVYESLKNEINEKLKVVHFTGVGRKINADYLL